MRENHHRLHHGQLDLFAHGATGRVFHHHLIAALVGFARILNRQHRSCGSVNHLAVESPQVLDRLRSLRLHFERRSLSLDHPRLLRLLRDRDRLMNSDLRIFTGGFAGCVFDHHAVQPGILRNGAGDLQNRVAALQQ